MDNVTNNWHNGNGGGLPFRPPTVDEALQYSPLSSIVPFSPDIIPFPSAGPPSSSAIFTTIEDRRSARRELEALDSEAQNPQSTSAQLQRTLSDLRQLLNADELTQFQFKPIAQLATPPSDDSATSTNGCTPTHSSAISPFAAMMLKATDIAYIHPKKHSNVKPHRQGDAQKSGAQPSPKPIIHPQVVVKNETGFKQNGSSQATPSQISPSVKAAPKQSPHGPGFSEASVIIPALPPSSQRDDYQRYPHLEIQDGLSKKRKREEADAEDEALAVTSDQRQKADAAVNDLNIILQDVFQAEDDDHHSNVFLTIIAGDSEVKVLQRDVQSRIEKGLQRVITAGRLSSVPVESVSRMQKLCESSVVAVEDISLSVGSDWATTDIEEWLYRVDAAGNGLQAAKILLRTMTAGRDEKQLYSEDLVQAVISAARHVLETCFIPIVELRSSDSNTDIFKVAASQNKLLSATLQQCGSVLRLLGTLLGKGDVADRAINSAEDLSCKLIFVENAHSEKESALGIQKFEAVRRHAMDILAKIFARYQDQRVAISDDILTSLEKLPVQRQSARQFKMVDGKPIQLVSALIMRLVQTSGTRTIRETRIASKSLVDAEGDEEDESSSESDMRSPTKSSHLTNGLQAVSTLSLGQIMKELYSGAEKTARYIVNFIVQRAMTSTKTGDQPYRNLLDIFTEDFLTVLGSPEWPAAQLLLRIMFAMMLNLLQNDKSTVPTKNMALDVMGLMGSGIIDFKLHVQQTTRSLDIAQSELSNQLVLLAEDSLRGDVNPKDLIDFEGPYRIVLEYLQLLSRDDDLHMQCAIGCHITNWAFEVCELSIKGEEDEEGRPRSKSLEKRLKHMMLDPKWLASEYEFEAVSTAQGRLAAGILTLGLPFYKYFNHLLHQLLNHMTSPQATLKSRSLKSITQLLEKDPEILKQNEIVVNRITTLMSKDASPLVRDNALTLLSKCLLWDPTIEVRYLDHFIQRMSDQAIGVKKRAMKTTKDIYLRNENNDAKSRIVEHLLLRVKDYDEGVADIARQTFEEIWMFPFYESSKSNGMKNELTLRREIVLMIKAVEHAHGPSVVEALEALLHSLLSNKSKTSAANYKVCEKIVAEMFEGVIDTDLLPGNPPQAQILRTLSIFAKSEPKLFTASQVQLLEPYTKNLRQTDELLVYRCVLVIFRHVFPRLSNSSLQEDFFRCVHTSLMQTVSKMGKLELYDIAQCLWIIGGILKDTFEKVVRLIVSLLKNINKDKELPSTDLEATKRLTRYLVILGAFGKVCNFEERVSSFKALLSTWKGNAVANLLVETVCPLTKQSQARSVREQALETLGMICQNSPSGFMRSDVGTAFDLVFINKDATLERILLSQFQEFFAAEERRSESGAEIAVGQGEINDAARMGTSLQASENDGAALSLARKYLQHVVRIALGKTENLALTATQVIISISKQGLVHPKECGPALVALETSPIPAISTPAFEEHRALHHKHETMFEKEYMAAVGQAFNYQRDIIEDTHGSLNKSYSPKLRLLFEVLKTGSSKVRKKFLSNLCEKIDFELPKLDSSGDKPHALLYARFVLENLAFFEYPRIDEILHVIACLEKSVTRTGAVVAHVIETDVLGIRLEPELGVDPAAAAIMASEEIVAPPTDIAMVKDEAMMQIELTANGVMSGHVIREAPPSSLPKQVEIDIDEAKLRHLTTATIILTMMWEARTFLRRQWGLQKQNATKQTANSKNAAKDLNRTPTKVGFVTGDKLWDRFTDLMSCITTPEAMKTQCKAFADLLNVDNELKVGSENEDDDMALTNMAAGYETPDDEDGENGRKSATPSSGRGRKRKAGSHVGLTPKKAKIGAAKGRGRPSGSKNKNKRSMSRTPDGEDGDWD